MTGERRTEVNAVTGSLKHASRVDVIELGVKELTIATEAPLQVGDSFQFTLVSPSGQLEVPGVIAWCAQRQPKVTTEQKVQSVFHSGVSLSNLSNHDLDALRIFLADTMMITLKNRIFGSFDIPQSIEEVSVQMGASSDFKVTKIGMTGCKVLTRFKPDLGSRYEMELQLAGVNDVIEGKVKDIQPVDDQFLLKIRFTKIRISTKKRLQKLVSDLKARREAED